MARDLKSYTEDGWMVLDVRPPSETRKVHVSDAVEVPLFVPDTSLDPSSLLKQMSAFGLGGWWLGGTHMKPNNTFMADVQAKVCCYSPVLLPHVLPATPALHAIIGWSMVLHSHWPQACTTSAGMSGTATLINMCHLLSGITDCPVWRKHPSSLWYWLGCTQLVLHATAASPDPKTCARVHVFVIHGPPQILQMYDLRSGEEVYFALPRLGWPGR